MAQCAQLQPQEDLPRFLSLISLIIIAATIRASRRHIIMVTMFFAIHVNINTTPFTILNAFCVIDRSDLFNFNNGCKLCCLFVRTYKHINDSCKQSYRKYKTYDMYVSCKQKPELIYH